jgi:hypothetical protein
MSLIGAAGSGPATRYGCCTEARELGEERGVGLAGLAGLRTQRGLPRRGYDVADHRAVVGIACRASVELE